MAMQAQTKISSCRACCLVGISRTVLHYQPAESADTVVLRTRLGELVAERRRFAYWRLHVLVCREGIEANHKRIYRLHSQAGLAVRSRRKRERVAVERELLSLPSAPNEVWSMDFVSDALADGRRIKILTIVDD